MYKSSIIIDNIAQKTDANMKFNKVDMAVVRCYIVHIMNIVGENHNSLPHVPLKCTRSPRFNFISSAVCTVGLVIIIGYGASPDFFNDSLAMLVALLVIIGIFDVCHYRADAFKPKPQMFIDHTEIELNEEFTLFISFKNPPANLKLDICHGKLPAMSFDLTRPKPESELKLALHPSAAPVRGAWSVHCSGWRFRLPVTLQKTVKLKPGEKIPDVLLQTQLVNNMKGLD